MRASCRWGRRVRCRAATTGPCGARPRRSAARGGRARSSRRGRSPVPCPVSAGSAQNLSLAARICANTSTSGASRMPSPAFTSGARARRNGLVAFSSSSDEGTVGVPSARARATRSTRLTSAGLSASTVSANLPLAAVYSWPEQIRVSSGRAASRVRVPHMSAARALEQPPAAERHQAVAGEGGAERGGGDRRHGRWCGRRHRSPAPRGPTCRRSRPVPPRCRAAAAGGRRAPRRSPPGGRRRPARPPPSI